jgi:hypothetical protein
MDLQPRAQLVRKLERSRLERLALAQDHESCTFTSFSVPVRFLDLSL